ncbi:MAG: 50S ribosomal protein L4 [Candidatus Omnitrophica bacterium]|nr:50S ribosomal protein L4 [Candidatus Omnitrophota bacterium]MDD5610852.1 50S ribosomal protein L4 [Candidatus Omnitrophota bacterium]
MNKQEFTLPIYNMQGDEIDKLSLDQKVFDGEVNPSAVYQAVLMYRANQRRGLAATKTRGEVSGGGKKPWKQKGTGRARVGSTRSPLWRHGGVIFGPHPRDFSYSIPEKIKRLALRSSLNAKLLENNFLIIDEVKLSNHKTKEVAKILGKLKVKKDALLLLEKIDNDVKLAARNIPHLKMDLAKNTNVYDVLNSEKLIITKRAVTDLVHRIKP